MKYHCVPKKEIPLNYVDAVAPFSFGSRDAEESRPPISLGFSATSDIMLLCNLAFSVVSLADNGSNSLPCKEEIW